MTTNGHDSFALLAKHLALALAPLRRGVADFANFRALMADLGWDVTSLPSAYANLAGLVEALLDAVGTLDGAAGGDGTSPDLDSNSVLEATLGVLARVTDLYDTLGALGQPPAGIAPADVAAFLAELGERLFELLVADYLAAAAPPVYQAARVLALIEREFHPATTTRPSFTRTRIRYDRLAELFQNPGSLPAQVYGWGTPTFDFPRLRDHVYELLWALRIPASIELTEPALAEDFQLVPPGGTASRRNRVRVTLFGIPVADRIVEVGLAMLELPPDSSGADGGASQAGVIIQPLVPSEAGTEAQLGEALTLRVRAGTDLAQTFGLLLRPGSIQVRYPFAPGTALPSAGFGAAIDYSPAEPTVLLGRPGGSRVELVGWRAELAVDLRDGQLKVAAAMSSDGLAAVLDASELDGFLGTVLGGATAKVTVPLGFTWSSRTGFTFTGRAGFEHSVRPALRIGPVTVTELGVALRSCTTDPGSDAGSTDAGTTQAGASALTAQVAFALAIDLGPVSFAVEGLRIAAELVTSPGNAGPFDLAVGLRPPTGLGLGIAAGPVQGGGFASLDAEAGRYRGALALRVGEVDITGLASLETRLPSGGPPWSLLVMLTGRFPGIPVGFGASLTGIGGLLAVNRRIDTDALAARFAAGTMGALLAPTDPAADAGLLVADLDEVFPVADGVTVAGPTAQLTWSAGLVTLDLGIFFEFPGPARVVVLGTVRAVIEHPDGGNALVLLRADVVGVVDVARRTATVDGMLVGSRLLEVFTLTGGAALRLGWGAEPYALFSIGGLHPAFDPGPVTLPATLTRVSMTRGTPADDLYLRLTGYFAVTSNSLQLGASVEVQVRAGEVVAAGFLSFDLLVRFRPFHFTVNIQASVQVRVGTTTIAGVKLVGTLAGPGPLTFTGQLSVEVLFFEISVRTTFELGRPASAAITPVASALDLLAGELRDPTNLAAADSSSSRPGRNGERYVVLAGGVGGTAGTAGTGGVPAADGVPPVIPPAGQLAWSQRTAPRGMLLERIDGTPLARAETVRIVGPAVSDEVRDWFAPGAFAELTDSEALHRRAFERLQAGAALTLGADVAANPVSLEVGYDEYLLTDAPAPSPQPTPAPQPTEVHAGPPVPPWVNHRVDGGARFGALAPLVTVTDELWDVRDAAGTPLASGITQAQAHQLARAAPAGAVAVPAGDLLTTGPL